MIGILRTALGVAGIIVSLGAARAAPLSFVALGDMPYGRPEAAYPPYRALIGAINAAAPAVSIHVGDFKSGTARCSDEEFTAQLDHFNRFAGALVFTPGDNDWTDCHRPTNGGYDPRERLQRLREMFYPAGRSLGQQPIAVESQAQAMPRWARYVENLRFTQGEALFVTLNIPGGNNGLSTREPAAVAEYEDRDAANVAWIEDAFAEAVKRGARALVFAFQADVAWGSRVNFAHPQATGFRRSIGETLVPLAARWGKPVLVVSGDSHRYRVDRPFAIDGKSVPNLVRLTVPGEDDVRAVRVTIDPDRPEPFAFEPLSAPPR